MDTRPIGVFDSGIGGLTVLKQLIKTLPNEDFIYFGDTARVPYGTRSKETITKFAIEDSDFLLTKNVKCIVIACNTASSVAGKMLEARFRIPVFDVITPALNEAKKKSKTGKLGVIGTKATINSDAYKLKYAVSCPLFVPFIEENETEGEAIKLLIKKYLFPIKTSKVDTLILGCTHYPLIMDLIKQEMGKNVELIDPGIPLAKTVKDYLTKHNLLSNNRKNGKTKYYLSDITESFIKLGSLFLGEKAENVTKVELG